MAQDNLPNINDINFPIAKQTFPLRFKLIDIIPVSKDLGRVLIRWELVPTTLDLSDFEFYIDRGEAQDQIPAFQHVTIDGKPWVSSHPSETTDSVNSLQIGGPISGIDFYQFMDQTPLLRNLWKMYFYRIRIRRISTQEEVGSAPITWLGDQDLEGLYVIDEHNFLLEDTIGTPCLAFPRRRGGVLCDKCFDRIQNKRISSHCEWCYGTNWQGGFHKPIDLFVDFSPEVENTVIRDWGETQPTESDILLANFPLLQNGDFILEMRQGRRWRVTRCRHTEKRRVPMLQFVRVVEINPGDVEYKFPVDQEFIATKVREFEEYKKRREF